MHWENMKVMICNPSKVEEAVQLKVTRGCQQKPFHLGHVEDEIRTLFVNFFFLLGG
jgi:hypothetical protein